MQRMTFLIFWLLAMTLAPINAQDDDYPLHIPDTDEYIAHMSEIWAQRGELPHMFDEEAYGLHMPQQLIRLMETTFLHRYAESASTTQLTQAYETLNQGDMFGYANYMPFIDIQQWNLRIVHQWTMENSVEFQDNVQLEFGPYTITVSDHHLTDLREPDILLRVSRDGFVDHWLAFPDNGAYRMVPGPVTYFASGYWNSWPNGTVADVAVLDVNADGLEEIISKRWNGFPGSNYRGSRTTYTVYGWQNEAWTTFVRSQSVTNDANDIYGDIPQWQFDNIDDDASLELIQNDYGRDNFYCLQHRRQVFDWNGEVYEVIADETTFEETVGCALRFAQQAMWEHDYEDAIDYYELALARFSGDFADYESDQGIAAQFVAYAQERLFIAYMLAADTVAARALLDDLREQPLIENTIAQQLIAIPEAELDPLTVCETVYDFIESIQNERNYRSLPHLGFIEETVHIYASWGIGVGQPQRVACDLPYLLEQIALMTATPPPTATPLPTATPDAILLAEQQAQNDIRLTVFDLAHTFRSGDIYDVLSQSETVLDSLLVGPTSDIALLARHYRALALEALDRPDEVLAEYLAIIDTAPNSAWGMLAALHLEVDE